MKKKRKAVSRVLSVCIALTLVLSLLPFGTMSAKAVDEPEARASADENLVLNKTAQLEDDGTYTITLEAYAKGQVSTETVKSVVPTDIVLVLDQSGSMGSTDEKEIISGIPDNTYTSANPTNGEVINGSYYYRVDDQYYRVTARKETVSVETKWVGDDGNTYNEDELSYSWSRKSDGQVYNTARPFVTSSLSTWTRSHTTFIGVNSFFYINDQTGAESKSGISAARARTQFENQYAVNGYTVEFHNDGNPGTTTEADDPYYAAAVYMAVTQQEVHTYQYTYLYTDENGKEITIGHSGTGTEEELDAAACSISPLYTRNTKEGTRLEALQYAANQFIDDIRANALANNVDHRVAVVGFASSGSNYNQTQYENTELFVGSAQYRYNGTGTNAPSSHYAEALQNTNTDTGYANLQASVNALDCYGGTYPQYGFEMANGVFANNSADYTKSDGTQGTRNRIVIFMTDGEPGSGNGAINASEANATVRNAGISKQTYNAKVYTVAVLNTAPTEGGDQDAFLKNVSSDGSYTLATDAELLEGFFSTVSETITNTTTTVSLTDKSILTDRLSSYFVVPDDFSIEKNVTVQVAKHAGNEAFLNPTAAPASVTATPYTGADGDVRGVSVSGFNFVSSENTVTTSVSGGGSTIANGNKLVVTIKGLLAKDEAATNTYIATNLDQSGILDVDQDGAYAMVKAFNIPVTKLTKKTFVIDYAKETELNVFGTSAGRVDSDEDALFSKVDESAVSLSEEFGNVAVENGKLTFTPTKMNWNGYDTFYALGKDITDGDQKTKNIWSKVSVIPANNVYYEDDFITSTTTGTVGIVYSEKGWDSVGTSSGNKESANTEVHGGWQNADLADDTTYSDGSAHQAAAGATATFTFTGTGVDVYSRTNLDTGIIKAELYEGTEQKPINLMKILKVDNLAESGDYYQIPTLSFGGLEHGTYTLKLTVQSSGDGRSTYYLDGIRVYNPLSDEQEADPVVSGAYGDEIGAVFTEVRNILLDAGDLSAGGQVEGIAFIDHLKQGTSEIATYEQYGPKNEVYLKKDQAIAFCVSDSAASHFYLGLKSPEGTTVKVTNGDAASDIVVKSASDLYYEITPGENGIIVVKNTSDNLLAITKLKVTGDAAVSQASAASLLEYADAFDSLPVVAYMAVQEEPEMPVEPGDVMIDNPETEEPADVVTELQNWLEKIFRGFRGWFRP